MDSPADDGHLRSAYRHGQKTTVRIVWLLGAGASAESGYPLVRDFPTRQYARRLAQLYSLVGTRDVIDNTFRSEARYLSSQTGDLNAITEDCVARGDTAKLRRIHNFVVGAIDMVRQFHHDQFWHPHLNAFAHYVGASDSSVISFNYDTLVEEQLGYLFTTATRPDRALLARSKAPYHHGLAEGSYQNLFRRDALIDCGSGYLLTREQREGTVLVLKPHGSMEWHYCNKCHLVVHQSSPVSNAGYIVAVAASEYPCPNCKTTTIFERLLVPPACDGAYLRTPFLETIWEQAETALLAADVLIIVGYSFPASDHRLRQLLRRVSGAHRKLTKVVVEPFLTVSSQERFTSVLGECQFYKGSFYDFISDICRAWSGFQVSRSDLDWCFKLLLSKAAARKEVLVGAVPLDVSPNEEVVRGLRGASPVAWLYGTSPKPTQLSYDCLNLTGVSGSEEELGQLTLGATVSADPVFTASCIRALGNARTQAGLNKVGSFLTDLSPLVVPNLDGGSSSYYVADYALAAVCYLLLTSRERLDYSRTRLWLEVLSSGAGMPRSIRTRAATLAVYGFETGLLAPTSRWRVSAFCTSLRRKIDQALHLPKRWLNREGPIGK